MRVALLVAIAGLAAWVFWPIRDTRWAIHFDPAATRAAHDFLAAPVPAGSGAPRPNVVVILADDLGKHDVSTYAPAAVPTPSLERIAREGVTFTAGYVTSPVCSPSRAALMTGRQQQRFGFELLTHDRYPRDRFQSWIARTFLADRGWAAIPEARVPLPQDVELQGLPPSEITLAELMKKHGYDTGMFGKWHLGVGHPALPNQRGFDYHYGFYEAFSLFAPADDPTMVGVHDDLFADRYQWWAGRRGNSAIRRNGELVDEKGYLTTRIAEEASQWIAARAGRRPFFAYIPFNAPHAPMQVAKSYADRFTDEPSADRRVYLGMIAALDDAVGQILDTLDRTGVANDTLVFFLSDNGAATYTRIARNDPLRGGKLMNFEGGINVPFLARWPAQLPAGATFRDPVSAIDVFMTTVRAAGAALPSDRPYDGVDLVPYLTGAGSGAPHDALYWRAAGHRAIRAGRYKLISDAKTGARVLYDLEADPYEAVDLSEREPALVERLEARLAEWEKAMKPPLWPIVMEYHFREGGRDFVFPL
jgi:arylsulfatase A-like enzyme